MGSRRLGRKRINSLNKLGETSGLTAGPGTKDMVVSSTVRREGSRIYTEIVVDFGTSKATVAAANTLSSVIGVNGAGDASLGQITTAVNGFIIAAEMVCTEVPTSGTNAQTDVDLAQATAGTHDQAADISGVAGFGNVIEAAGAWTLGQVDGSARTIASKHSPVVAANAHLYLTCGAAQGGGNQTGGKYVITLEGVAVASDI